MIKDLEKRGKNINFEDFLEVVYAKLGDTKSK